MKIQNPAGLAFDFLENGAVKCIEAGPIRINLKPATPFSGSGTNIYLRRMNGNIAFTPLLGPGSPARFLIEKEGYIARGNWEHLEFTCALRLSEDFTNWQWQVEIRNMGNATVELDLVYLQDISLKPAGAGPVNEYYVSQYLERRIMNDRQYGAVVCCRQNMKETTGHPWLMLACGNGAASATTDGMLFYGSRYRQTGVPEGLTSERLGGEYAGESSVIALQEKPFNIAPGERHVGTLAALYLPDHPEATSEKDLEKLKGLITGFRTPASTIASSELKKPVLNLFNTCPLLPVEDLDEKELFRFFGNERRHPETTNGKTLSFFSETGSHVVLLEKEIRTDRPHAHIMQANTGLVPDEAIVSTTAFAFGVFNSHLTQGNTNFNVLLSICTSQFNQSPDTGLRIFVELEGRIHLLGTPSAFEMGLNHCRWIYKHGSYLFQVRTWTSGPSPQVSTDIRVIRGGEVRMLVSHQLDLSGNWKFQKGENPGEYVFRPGAATLIAGKFPLAQFRMIIQQAGNGFSVSGDEALFEDGKQRGNPHFVLDVEETSAFCLSIVGEVIGEVQAVAFPDPEKQWFSDQLEASATWKELSRHLELESDQPDIAAIREILPWYGMNALIHYLTPYGLEQFGGAAWGTRDVSQGPVDLLLALEKYSEARKVLCIIFSHQNPDGGWPQWWMFDSYRSIRADEAHGDIFYWCMLALAKYIRVTGDTGILDEQLPYYQQEGKGLPETKPLREHMDRLIHMITGSFIPGTALVPFGGGDWNDSLQPVSRELARRLVSSWTVEMNYQAFSEYSRVCLLTGDKTLAEELRGISQRIRSDFNRYLVRDGVVSGYGIVEDDGSIGILLHPSDIKTGIRYSILPMDRGIISGLFTAEQADGHQNLIREHLLGPDGARLMDRPLRYKGGIQEIFQRAESSTFFGREIGLMYVHEHIRYAESLSITGRADDFVLALRKAIPVSYREVVPIGDLRQANCYYSSSDVAFRNRYEADDRYAEVMAGNFPVKGGWRVYSSGPGIFVALVVTRLLGLRIENDQVVFDPVMPLSMDGLTASLNFLGYPVKFVYDLKNNSFSPHSLKINGNEIAFTLEENKYRKGGAVIPKKLFVSQLNEERNTVEIGL